MLTDYIDQLQVAHDNLQCKWLNKRDEVEQHDLNRVTTFVDKCINTGDAALRKADRLIVQGTDGRPRSPPRGKSHSPEKVDKLDNTLKPVGNLTRDMTLEEAKNWIRKFDEWFKWNAPVLDKKDKLTRRVLLENFLDDRMLSRIKSDISVDEDTPIRGANGLLVKLESYYFYDQPMIIRRHNFTTCKQDRG